MACDCWAFGEKVWLGNRRTPRKPVGLPSLRATGNGALLPGRGLCSWWRLPVSCFSGLSGTECRWDRCREVTSQIPTSISTRVLKLFFLLSSKEPLFSTFPTYRKYGLWLLLSVLCVVFADNFCEHKCLVQFCCKLTHHEMHC